MRSVAAANLALRFLLELGALAALAFWGFHEHSGAAAWLWGLGAPVAAAALWGAVVAPKAAFTVSAPVRFAAELAVFAAAVVALAAAGRTLLAILLGALWAANRAMLTAAGELR
jgi:uncharacterized protein DUF2568